MDETLDPGFDLNEGPVRHQVGDLTLDLGSGWETLLDFVPRIVLGLFESERDALFVLVDLENLQGNFLANLEQFARMGESAPCHVGDVE